MINQVIVACFQGVGEVVDYFFLNYPQIADVYWNFCFDQVWWRFM